MTALQAYWSSEIRNSEDVFVSVQFQSTGTCFCFPSLKIRGTYWSRGYKTFFMLNSTEHEIFTAHNC